MGGLAQDMIHSNEARGLSAEQIVAVIAGAVNFTGSPSCADRQLAMAREGLDARLAELALEPVLARLEAHPQDVQALLALVLLGHAHPEVAALARVAPEAEALRLIERLEAGDAGEWALAVARAVGVEQRGDQAAGGGRREVGEGRRLRAARVRALLTWRPKRALVACVLGGLLMAAGLRRELDLRAELGAIPAAEAGRLESVEARVAGLSLMMERRGPWLGLPGVAAEHMHLAAELRRLARAEELQRAGERRAARDRVAAAEEARERALLAFEAGSLEEARRWFSQALARGGEDWEGAHAVAQDLDRLGAMALAGGRRVGRGSGVAR